MLRQMNSHLIKVAIGLILSASALSPQRCAAQASYTITDLGTLGGSQSSAFALNDAGKVVGWALTASGDQHAFLYSNGVMLDLGTFGGTFSEAFAINNAGQAVGRARTAGDTDIRAFLYSGGGLIDLGTLGGTYSEANGINTSGQIVGRATIENDSEQRPFLFSGGVMTDLGTLGGTPAPHQAFSINDVGQIVGWSKTTAGPYHAFLYSSGLMQDLGTLPGKDFSIGQAINSTGQVVGVSHSQIDASDGRAFLYYGGAMQDLGTLGGSQSRAYAINSANHVVGSSANAAELLRAFIYRDGVMMDLNSLIPADSGWRLFEARGINDQEQIVGIGFNGTQFHAFLLTPTAPPPPQQISNLTSAVQSYGLPDGIDNSLTVKLNAALAAYNSGDTVTSCMKLTDFINQVNAQSGKKLSTEQATSLVAAARQIKTAIGCP